MSTPITPPTSSRPPFLIVPELLSPLSCEEVVGEVGFDLPTYDPITNKAVKTVTMNKVAGEFLSDILEERVMNLIDAHFGVEVEAIDSTLFEWYPEGHVTQPAAPEVHKLIGGQWTRSGEADFIGVLFLMDYHDGKSGPIDTDYEVYGGKLEFPNFKFGFNPKAGTLVVYPAASNFANATTTTEIGELYQVRFYIRTTLPYTYDPRNFSGNHTTWFR